MSKNVDGNSRFRYDLILWRYYTFKGTVQGYFGPQFFHNLNLRPLTNGRVKIVWILVKNRQVLEIFQSP